MYCDKNGIEIKPGDKIRVARDVKVFDEIAWPHITWEVNGLGGRSFTATVIEVKIIHPGRKGKGSKFHGILWRGQHGNRCAKASEVEIVGKNGIEKAVLRQREMVSATAVVAGSIPALVKFRFESWRCLILGL